MPQFHHTMRRRGLTLVELLVVISILIILVAVLLPMMQLGTEARIVREATRQVNAYLAGAQARAVATGRPVGVMFVRNPNNNSQCFQLTIAKVPPPYSGADTNSAAGLDAGGNFKFWSNRSTAATIEDIPLTILPVGSAFQVRLNYRGAWYPGVRISANDYQLLVDNTDLPKSLLAPIVARLPFQMRRPPRPSATAPLELPVGAYLDLSLSGTGTIGTELAPAFPTGDASATVDPPVILYGPRGNVELVYRSVGVAYMPFVPLEPLHLLVGRAADLATPSDTSLANLLDNAESLWLSVNPNSGKVNSTESLGLSLAVQSTSSPGQILQAARRAALAGQSMGGR